MEESKQVTEERLPSEESEEEIQERKDHDKDQAESKVTMIGVLPEKFDLIVCGGEASKTMAKLIWQNTWMEVGGGQTNHKEKVKDTLKLYAVKPNGADLDAVVVIVED